MSSLCNTRCYRPSALASCSIRRAPTSTLSQLAICRRPPRPGYSGHFVLSWSGNHMAPPDHAQATLQGTKLLGLAKIFYDPFLGNDTVSQQPQILTGVAGLRSPEQYCPIRLFNKGHVIQVERQLNLARPLQ